MRRARKRKKVYTRANKGILARQMIYAASSIIAALFLRIVTKCIPAFVTLSGILAGALGRLSLANGGILCYNTVRGDARTRTRARQAIWAALVILETCGILPGARARLHALEGSYYRPGISPAFFIKELRGKRIRCILWMQRGY